MRFFTTAMASATSVLLVAKGFTRGLVLVANRLSSGLSFMLGTSAAVRVVKSISRLANNMYFGDECDLEFFLHRLLDVFRKLIDIFSRAAPVVDQH